MDRVSRLNAIIEILRSSSGRVQKIFIQKEKGDRKIGEIIRLAKDRGIPFVFVPKPGLDETAPGHQGAVAVLAAREFVPVEDILARTDRPFLVLLDEIEDPQNLGAIIRTAEAAGADGLVLPERHSAGVTETVMEVSAGAAEHIPVARVKNLAQAMSGLKERGLWLVGAEAGQHGELARLRLHGPRRHRPRLRGPGPAPPHQRAMRQAPVHPPFRPGQFPERGRRRRGFLLRGRPPAAPQIALRLE